MRVHIRCADEVHFVRVARDGRLDATAHSAGLWETFEVTEFADGRIALSTLDSHPQPNMYVRAAGGGGGDLIADREQANEHEKFTKVELERGGASLQTANGCFWRAKDGGGSSLDAKATESRAWEVFSFHN